MIKFKIELVTKWTSSDLTRGRLKLISLPLILIDKRTPIFLIDQKHYLLSSSDLLFRYTIVVNYIDIFINVTNRRFVSMDVLYAILYYTLFLHLSKSFNFLQICIRVHPPSRFQFSPSLHVDVYTRRSLYLFTHSMI